MTYPIDKDIPIPDLNKARNVKYPWVGMEIGDSFYTDVSRLRIAAAASAYDKRNNQKHTIRADGDGFRVWRIA